MPRATVNGIEIAYTDEGAGVPVVFIHGYPLNRTMWEPQVSALSTKARCIAVDLRGHGESQAPLWSATVEMYADDVKGLLDHLGVDRAVICGFSMGGYVTFAFYRKYRERVLGLILADTRPQADTLEGRQGRFASAQTAQAEGAKAIADAMVPRLLTKKSLDERRDLAAAARRMIESTPLTGIAGDLMAMAERPDSVELLGSIDCQTLVIVGEEDALTPPADARLMAEKIRGARLTVIPGAAHLANLEDAAAFNKAVAAFLDSLPA